MKETWKKLESRNYKQFMTTLAKMQNFCGLFLLLLVYIVQICGKKVVITGAAGRTGSIVMQKLAERNDSFQVLGLTRTDKSAKKLLKSIKFPSDATNSVDVQTCDITDPNALAASLKDADTVVLCTSAVPKIKPFSIIKLLVKKIFKKQGRPEFRFIDNGDPYTVDWLGAKNQIDQAKDAGVKQFIFVSSMGGTQPENFLNTIGRVEGDDKSGNILLWKRKAEKYLIDSGLTYTIVHPGGLLDQPGGRREIIADVDDILLKREVRSIPRADVAEICIQAIINKSASNKSFDIISGVDQEKDVNNDWNILFNSVGNCKYD